MSEERHCATCKYENINTLDTPCFSCFYENHWEPKAADALAETAEKMRKAWEQLSEAFTKWARTFYPCCPTCGKPIPKNRKYCSIRCRVRGWWRR